MRSSPHQAQVEASGRHVSRAAPLDAPQTLHSRVGTRARTSAMNSGAHKSELATG
jgi:hypothetical protein